MFEKMGDEELAVYVKARNTLAIEVAKRRAAAAAAQPLQARGFEPG